MPQTKTPLSPILRDKGVYILCGTTLTCRPRTGPTPQCASNNARLLITEACRPGLHTAAAVSARKLGEDLPTGFMHCLASTGSSLKHSTRVLVLVIAEYFTDTEYTPLQALRQGAAACCFFMPETAQNNPVHPTERVECEYSAKNLYGICAIKQKKKRMSVIYQQKPGKSTCISNKMRL